MAILGECPICKRKQSIRKKRCSCGEDLDKAKNSKRVRYWINYRLPGGKQRRELVGTSIEEARDAEGKRRAQKRENRLFDVLPKSRQTFEQLCRWYIELASVKRLAMYAIKKYHLEIFNKRFGNVVVSHLKPAELQDFRIQLRQSDLSKSYIDQIVGTAKTMINMAIDNDKISADCLRPFKKTKRLLKRNANARDMIISPDQYARLILKAPRHIKPIIAVAYYTGMRKGEILGLRWHQVLLKQRLIKLTDKDTKDEEPRLIPIISPLLYQLKSIPRAINDDHVFLFRGMPLRDVRDGFVAACEAAGVPYGRNTPNGITFHDLRHTANTNMRRAGIPESVIMKITGHSTREMFDRYNTVDRDDAVRAGNDFEVFLRNVDQSVDQAKKKGSTNSGAVIVNPCFSYGAEGETRTPTGEPQLDPEPSASTNSATSARFRFEFKRVDFKLKMH